MYFLKAAIDDPYFPDREATGRQGDPVIALKLQARKTAVGGKLFAGIDFDQGLFAEVEYLMPGSIRLRSDTYNLTFGGSFNGISTSLGYRF